MDKSELRGDVREIWEHFLRQGNHRADGTGGEGSHWKGNRTMDRKKLIGAGKALIEGATKLRTKTTY